MKKILKSMLVLGIGAAIGYFKGVADCAYHVHKGNVPEEKLDSFCEAVDEAKSALGRATKSAEEAAEDITEMVSDATEEVAEAVEETVENQPED